MKDFQKTLKVTWFGIKSSKALFILMLLLCCFFIPAFIYLVINESKGNYILNAHDMSVIGIIAAYAAGIFAPVMLFSYLHNRTEQDFYSAMPVKRREYFFGYFLSGMLTFLIPYTLMFIVCGFLRNSGLWAGFIKPVGMYFVLYCSVTLCMMFCTSKSGAAVTFVLRNGLAASLVVLPFVLASLDSDAYFELLSDKILMFTPLGTGFSILKDYEHVLPVQLIIALAELTASYFLYIGRRNETSLALAFPKTRYFYQYAVMTVAALYITALFAAMFGIDGYYGNDENWAYVIFFTVALTFMVFVILNMILEKNSKAAFHKIRHLFIFLAGFGIITSVTVNLLINLVPYSVLPFTPKFAVVRLYSVEPCDNEHDRSDLAVNIYNSSDYHIDLDGMEYYDGDYKRVRCYVTQYKALIVTDDEKLRALTSYAQNPTSYYIISRSNLSLLSSHSPWGYAGLDFEDSIPSDFIAVRIDFYNADVSFKDEITETALDELTARPSLSGTYRQSTRYGFGRGDEYISGFADVTVK